MKRVVVTGLGAVTPIGNDVPTFWQSLMAGRCGIGPITRFDTSGHKVRLAAEVRDFDPLAYMDKDQVQHRDRNVWYALAAAEQAMQESGLAGAIQPEQLAVYFGSGIGGIETFEREAQRLLERGPKRVSPYFIPMLIANMAAGEIAIRFQAQSACLSVVTACATATHAIGEAYRAIGHGYAQAAICGGAEAPITAIGVAGFANMLALHQGEDPQAASLPFDARRSGFVMGEGAGALILEERQHALDRGAVIHAEICGYGSTCDAYHITAPEPQAEGGARAIAQALAQAGGATGRTVYINAHGTGTPLNDAAETQAIKTALGEEQARRALISSTKSMTGHMLGAAGGAEAIAAILALEHSLVPPTINLQQPDPACDLDYVPGTARAVSVDLALSTSLGFGGHNACLAFCREAQHGAD